MSFCSINTKATYLKSFEKFVSDIEQANIISDDELTSKKKNNLDFNEAFYNNFENELTLDDSVLFFDLKFHYYAVMVKQGLKVVNSVLKGFR